MEQEVKDEEGPVGDEDNPNGNTLVPPGPADRLDRPAAAYLRSFTNKKSIDRYFLSRITSAVAAFLTHRRRLHRAVRPLPYSALFCRRQSSRVALAPATCSVACPARWRGHRRTHTVATSWPLRSLL